MVCFVHLRVSEEGFDCVLAVVESAFDGEAVHIFIDACGHLCLLDGGHFAIGEHDEDTEIRFTTEAIKCGTARVTARSPDDCKVMTSLASRKGSVASDEKELEEVADKLKSYIFKGEGGAVEEFKKIEIFRGVEADESNCFRMAEN